ncbi:MAG: class 1 fructose-bisphosphatase [Pseudomonadota bacterium]
MNAQRITLSAFLADDTHGLPKNSQLADLLLNIADTTKAIAKLTEKGALIDMVGKLESQNIQGETQMKLDVESNQIFIDNLTRSGLVAGLASEEMDAPVLIANNKHQGAYLVIFDPLDGSSNVAVNVSVGSIFSVLHAPTDALPTEQDYLQTGRKQVAAGYAIYGPCTMLVITVGKGTHGFTLDRDTGEFSLTHANIQIPEDTAEFAINASNERYWEPPIQRYISECIAGVSDNSREKNFNMRWIASMVADIHRILMRGGIYMYPKDNKDATMPGRLRLMYEANPMSMIVEQAGGLSSTGRVRIQDIDPEKVHQRVPVIMGSKNEVLRVESYHQP